MKTYTIKQLIVLLVLLLLSTQSNSSSASEQALRPSSPLCTTAASLIKFTDFVASNNKAGVKRFVDAELCFFLPGGKHLPLRALTAVGSKTFKGIPMITFKTPTGMTLWALEISIVNV